MSEKHPYPVVSIIYPRKLASGEIEILIQRRTKKKATYYGMWELPQGRIKSGESLETAATRELQEETKISLVSINSPSNIKNIVLNKSPIESFHPGICVIDMEKNYIGFPVVIKAKGVPQSTAEATSHKWARKDEVYSIISDEDFFPLNIPMLKWFFEEMEESWLF